MEDSAEELLEAARQAYFKARARQQGIEIAVEGGKRLADVPLLVEGSRFLLREQRFDELAELAQWCTEQDSVSGLGPALKGAEIVWNKGPTEEAAALFTEAAGLPGLTGYNQLNARILTTSARFLDHPTVEPKLPFSAPVQGSKRLVVVAADEVYFDQFAEIFVRNVRELAPTVGVHLHLYCRAESFWARALELQANPDSFLYGVSLSGELAHRRHYYMIGRYIHLPAIMDLAGASVVLMSDIDAMFLDSPEATFDKLETADVGIAEHKSYTFPWLNYRGNFSAFTDTPKSRAMLNAVSSFLAVLSPEDSVYAADQLALMQAFHAARDNGTKVLDLRESLHERTVQATGGGADVAGKRRRLTEAFEKQNRPR